MKIFSKNQNGKCHKHQPDQKKRFQPNQKHQLCVPFNLFVLECLSLFFGVDQKESRIQKWRKEFDTIKQDSHYNLQSVMASREIQRTGASKSQKKFIDLFKFVQKNQKNLVTGTIQHDSMW